MSVEPTPTAAPSAHGNGLLAVIMAMAASDAAGVDNTNLANNDLSTSEFMRRMYKLLGQFHGNMKAIEAFLKSYVANHEAGSAARERLTTGSVLSLQSLSTMADKIGDFEAKLKETQDKIDDLNKKLDDCNNQLAQLCDDNGMPYSVSMKDGKRIVTVDPDFPLSKVFAHWFSYSLERGGFLCPIAAATAAGIKEAAFAKDYGNLETTISSYGVELGNAATELGNIQTAETSLVSGTTGTMGSRADGISEAAKSMIQTANQGATLSFMFLESFKDQVVEI